jgi:hypothetical protein
MNKSLNNPAPEVVPSVPTDIRRLTDQQLAALGVAQIAYVRPVVVDGEAALSIHAADGTPMALTADLHVALAAVVHHEMVPTLVH